MAADNPPLIHHTDQRNAITLGDSRFSEILGRVPKGLEKHFAAIATHNAGWKNTLERLRSIQGKEPDERGNYRFLKDRYKYFLVKRDRQTIQNPMPRWKYWLRKALGLRVSTVVVNDELEERWSNVYTTINASQVPVYVKLFENLTQDIEGWRHKMLDLFVAQDGKSRQEYIEALQGEKGSILPAEYANAVMSMQSVNGKTPPKKTMFAGLKD